MAGIRIRGQEPTGIRVRGQDVSQVRVRGQKIWPSSSPALLDQVYQGAFIEQYWTHTIHGLAGTQYDSVPSCFVTDPPPVPNSQSFYNAQQGKTANLAHWGWTTAAQYPNFNAPSGTTFTRVRNNKLFTSAAFWGADTGATAVGYSAAASTAIGDLLAAVGTPEYNRAQTAYKAWFAGVLNIGHPIMVCPWWEPNGTWYAWGRKIATGSQYGNSPSLGPDSGNPVTDFTRPNNYKTIWQRTHTWCMEEAQRLGKDTYHRTGCMSFAWIMNDCRPGGQPDPTPWWPGTDHFDWTGWDAYHYGAESGYAYQSPSYINDAIYNVCKTLAPNLPMVINEYGAMEGATSPPIAGQNSKAQYFNALAIWLKAHPEVCCLDYFQWPEATGVNVTVHWDSSPEALAAFQNLIADPRYLDNSIVNATNFPLDHPVPDPRYTVFV